MLEQDPECEKYGWRTNMCYATKAHRDAIKAHGITKFHRKTFGICKDYCVEKKDESKLLYKNILVKYK